MFMRRKVLQYRDSVSQTMQSPSIGSGRTNTSWFDMIVGRYSWMETEIHGERKESRASRLQSSAKKGGGLEEIPASVAIIDELPLL